MMLISLLLISSMYLYLIFKTYVFFKGLETTGGISAALGFSNISLNIFGCELSPSCPTADYYTIGKGGSAQADSQEPSKESVAEETNTTTPAQAGTPQDPMAQPHNDPPQDLSAMRAQTAANANAPGNRVGDQVTDPGALDAVRAEQNINNPNYESDRQAATDSLTQY